MDLAFVFYTPDDGHIDGRNTQEFIVCVKQYCYLFYF